MKHLLMQLSLLWFIGLLLGTPGLAAAPAIDSSSAPLWKPCTTWVQKPPAKYEVLNRTGALVFRVEGAGSEMPWIVDLKDLGLTGDERYLLVRYKAVGMSTRPDVYFLHGEEGTHGGRTYAMADSLKTDGQWHTLAVDLVAVEPPESTHFLAIKVAAGERGLATLTVDKIQFAERLPADAQLAPLPPRPTTSTITVDWRRAGSVAPVRGWVPTPAEQFSAMPHGGEMSFAVRNKGKGMRWLLKLPEPIDLRRLPCVSFRYRASGQLVPSTYAVWLGGKGSGVAGDSVIAVSAGDLRGDGAWHALSTKVSAGFIATQLAVGLDCDGDEARLTLDAISFSSRPLRFSTGQSLDYAPLGAAWPAGKSGFIAAPVEIQGGTASPFFAQRLGLSDWFETDRIRVGQVPLVVERDLGRLQHSPLATFGDLRLKLPPGVREVYLLMAAAAPATEPWGLDPARPKLQDVLNVPEKLFFEIRYDTGSADRVLPLDAATGQWGLRRGLSLSVVHPDPARRATELLLADRMQTATFAIVGATMRTAAPRIAEPNWNDLSRGLAPVDRSCSTAAPGCGSRLTQPGAAVLQAQFDTRRGLSWSRLAAPSAGEELACTPGPLFQVTMAGRVIPNDDWTLEKTEPLDTGHRFLLRDRKAALAATVECVPSEGNQLLLRMTLTNRGKTATKATLHFPMLDGVRLGTAADTWYLCGKRGGIVQAADIRVREPLGEHHPLQMDGFFDPATGLALACLTHDTVAQHHFVNLAKSHDGGQWSIEYVDRDLAPGATFTTTEAALVLRVGGWRAIFAAYTDWLRSWFRPAAPRKDWFEKVFAVASGNVHFDACADPQARSAIQPMVDTMLKQVGLCDTVHLFGWGASRVYGEWGDYDHYEEIGGRERFRNNIAALQKKGIPVSLYLDAYLSCQAGQSVGAHAKQWAMKRADGSPQYIKEYHGYNQCPYVKGWQDYLSQTYRRVRNELGPQILYIDEAGATDGRWACWAHDHGHNGYEIPYAGEVSLLRRIRAAVGPDLALYTEYPPAEVSRRYLDGSITYQALWSADEEPLAPHFIDLPRFAFPDFKQFHILSYAVSRAGNWWLMKFPFFNGEVYRVGIPGLPGIMDEPAAAFLRRAVQIQCAHREAFASKDVCPLVATEVPGVFANRFAARGEIVWTVYNANGRNVRKPVLRVRHVAGASYEDAWNGLRLAPAMEDGHAVVALELDPKGVGCLVERLP
jgi:hypothetical protein